ncbi:MAG: hypothetical protein ABJL99_12685 [Aliishimia sp.]
MLLAKESRLFGLFPVVSRIAAIMPTELDLIDGPGPKPPSEAVIVAAISFPEADFDHRRSIPPVSMTASRDEVAVRCGSTNVSYRDNGN